MGINRYMLPAEQPAMQTYVSQHVDLPTDELGEYFDRQEAQQADMAGTEADILDSEAFIEDQPRQQALINESTAEAERISNINPVLHPVQYKKELAAYKRKYATPLAAIERQKEYKDTVRKKRDALGDKALWFGNQRADVASEVLNPITNEWEVNPDYDPSAQYFEVADYAAAYEAGIEEVDPNSYATALTQWSGGKGYLTYDDIKSIDDDDMNTLITPKFIEGQIAQRPELQQKLKTHLEKNNRNPHLTGKDAYEKALGKMVDESKSAFKDKLFKEVNPHYIADKEFETRAAIAKTKAGKEEKAPLISGYSVAVLEGAGYTMDPKTGIVSPKKDGKKGTYIPEKSAEAFFDEPIEVTQFGDAKQNLYVNDSQNKFLMSKTKEAEIDHDLDDVNDFRIIDKTLRDGATLEGYPERFTVSGMFKYLDDTSQSGSGGTAGNYVFKNAVTDTYNSLSTEIAQRDHDKYKSDYKLLFDDKLAENPNYAVHNPIMNYLTADNPYTTAQKQMLDLYHKMGWDGKGLMLFSEDKDHKVDKTKYEMSVDPNNESLKRAKAKIKRLQEKYPNEEKLKYATAETLLNTKLKNTNINVSLGQDKDGNNFRVSNGSGYLKNQGHMTASDLVNLATSTNDAGADEINDEMLEVMIDKAIDYNWPEEYDTKAKKVAWLIKLHEDEPKAIASAVANSKKPRIPKRKEFIFNFTSEHNVTADGIGNEYDKSYYDESNLKPADVTELASRRKENLNMMSSNVELGNQVSLMASEGLFSDGFLVDDLIKQGAGESERIALEILVDRANNKAIPMYMREDAKLLLARKSLEINKNP